jgi:hypothetical protein
MGMRGGNGDDVMVVTVRKEKLVEKLTLNRMKHIAEFEKASGAYKKKLAQEYRAFKEGIVEYLAVIEETKNLEDLKSAPHFSSKLPRPQNYAEYYDRALGMLELHSKDEMTLDMATYRKYIEDDWEWSSQAAVSNRGYLVGG